MKLTRTHVSVHPRRGVVTRGVTAAPVPAIIAKSRFTQVLWVMLQDLCINLLK